MNLLLNGNKLTQEHGRLAFFMLCSMLPNTDLLKLLVISERIHCKWARSKISLEHFQTLLSTLDAELVRTRHDSDKLPIHITCRNKTPMEVLALILEHLPATLHMVDYALASSNREGALPLHAFCGSRYPSLRTVLYLIQSFHGAVAAQTNACQYPFMIAACETKWSERILIW
jgi:hypothetical protein